ncbi:hypothetical protein Tco_0912853, partial [Tanacetum coccineum]
MQLSTMLLRYLWIVKTGKSSLKQWPSLIRDAIKTKILLHLLQKNQTKARRKGKILMHLLQNILKLRHPQLRRLLTQEKLPLAPLNSEDTHAAHLLKIKTRVDWLKPVLEEEMPETSKPEWVIPPNELLETENNWANALAKTYKDPEENKL